MRRLAMAIVVLLLAVASTAVAQSMVFRWLDAKGNLHITDRLADVPEPYHSMYVARLKELEEQKRTGKVTPAQPAPRPAAPTKARPPAKAKRRHPAKAKLSIAEQEEADRKRWKATVARWRTDLEIATRRYEQTKTRLEQAQLNPILRTTPRVQADIRRYTAQLEAERARVEKARKMLLEELPARAKKEGVPPRWLE